jgi:G3E family GTPase
MPVPPSIPVTILSGFLGAGKSTILNDLLAHPQFGDTAVVINEFGDISIDHDLVRVGEREMMVTTTGCMCCTAGSDIRSSLFDLHEASQRELSRSFARVIIETTGLADPAPIVNQLIPGGAAAAGLRDHVVARRFHLAGFVCVVDVTTAQQTIDGHFECLKQIAFADRIVLTKTDLTNGAAGPSGAALLVEQLREINPSVAIVDRRAPEFDLPALFQPRDFAVAKRTEDVEGWLAVESALAQEESLNAQSAGDKRGDTRHTSAGIRSVALFHDKPVSADRLMSFLDLLDTVTGPRLLRLKGIVHLEEDSERPLVIHAIQHAVFQHRLPGWPSADRRSRIIAITHNLDASVVKSLFTVITGMSFGAKARLALTIAGLAGLGIGLTVALSIALRSSATAQLGPVPDSQFKFHTHSPAESSQ